MGGQANLLGGEGSLRSLRLGETLALVKINDLTNWKPVLLISDINPIDTRRRY